VLIQPVQTCVCGKDRNENSTNDKCCLMTPYNECADADHSAFVNSNTLLSLAMCVNVGVKHANIRGMCLAIPTQCDIWGSHAFRPLSFDYSLLFVFSKVRFLLSYILLSVSAGAQAYEIIGFRYMLGCAQGEAKMVYVMGTWLQIKVKT
jgi:hypothetical protein